MKKKKGRNLYEKKITLGRDEFGMPVRKSITGRTLAELNEKIEYAKQAWMRMNDASDSMLFSTYAHRWFDTTKAIKSLNTRTMYINVLEKHIIPEIGDFYFDEISLSDLQAIINKRAEHYETCNKIRMTLKQIYAAALDDGLKANVKVDKLVLPPKKKSEKRALTDQEKDAILKCTTFTPEQRAFILLLYYTGLRREEALALNVSDIDLNKRTVSVKRTLIFDKNTAIVKDGAKTSASVRTVYLPIESIEPLKEYIKDRDVILFPMTTKESYMTLSSYVKFWNGIVKQLVPLAPSAEELTAHILRHNYATMLYYSNVSPKMAAKIMGHSNTQMIMQVYAHLDDAQEKVIEKLDSIFKQSVEQMSNKNL